MVYEIIPIHLGRGMIPVQYLCHTHPPKNAGFVKNALLDPIVPVGPRREPSACFQSWEIPNCKPYMGVSKNRGTPKSSILIEVSIINHPFWGTPIFRNTHIVSIYDNGVFHPQRIPRAHNKYHK